MLALYTFLAFSNASNCPWAYGVTECFIQDAEISVGRTPIDEVPYFGNQHWVLSQNWFSNASSFRTKMRIRDNRIEKPELSHIFPICFPICFHSFSHMFPYFPRNFPLLFPYVFPCRSRRAGFLSKHLNLHRGIDSQDAHAVWSGRSGSGLATGLAKSLEKSSWIPSLCQNSYWTWPLE